MHVYMHTHMHARTHAGTHVCTHTYTSCLFLEARSEFAVSSLGASVVLLSTYLTYSALYVSPSLQRKLPADSKVLEASDLVYTVSAHEYWQQALLTEEESGNFYFLTSTTNI